MIVREYSGSKLCCDYLLSFHIWLWYKKLMGSRIFPHNHQIKQHLIFCKCSNIFFPPSPSPANLAMRRKLHRPNCLQRRCMPLHSRVPFPWGISDGKWFWQCLHFGNVPDQHILNMWQWLYCDVPWSNAYYGLHT